MDVGFNAGRTLSGPCHEVNRDTGPSLPPVKQDRHRVVAAVGHREVGEGIIVEVADGNGLGRSRRALYWNATRGNQYASRAALRRKSEPSLKDSPISRNTATHHIRRDPRVTRPMPALASRAL